MTIEEKKKICNELLTREERMEALILKYFTQEDFERIESRKAGGGQIGGKACGLLVAHKLLKVKLPRYGDCLEKHNASFIGSEIFCRYLMDNGCMELRARHMEEKEHFGGVEELKEKLRNGVFSEELREGFVKILKLYPTQPLIIRSSSFLEDGYDSSFTGKYESVFCHNQGTEKERLSEFQEAIRQVYASTMNPGAIAYRKKRKLLGADEQMALLIQPVSGQVHGKYFMPLSAGMGCSYNPYKWMSEMNPDAGMLRMVVGLGTRAVERTPGDYPRLVGMDRARANFRTTVAERHKYSQRKVDVIDLEEKQLLTKQLSEIIPMLSYKEKELVLSRDTDAEERLRLRDDYRNVYFADCQGLVEQNEFIQMMEEILKMLEEAYERPVDIEYAVNVQESGKLMVNLLQCRPLQSFVSEQVHLPILPENKILFDVYRTSMRRSKIEKLDIIVWVDPQKYYEYPYARKPDVARLISRINDKFEDSKKMMLLVPGRIGTSSPELGVSVTYADINQFMAICEVAYSKAGYQPDLSYGSHMFQDLVEADIYYGAISENSYTKKYEPELLLGRSEILKNLWPEETELAEIVKVYDVSYDYAGLMLDAREGRAVCWI